MASNSESLKFMLQRDRWVVSYTDNPELAIAMSNIGVFPEQRFNQNQTKTYWFVPIDRFETVHPLLLSLGYSDYIKQPASASFQVSTSPKATPEKNVNPNHNPILYPNINFSDSQAASEFAQNHTFSVSELNKCLKSGVNKLFPAIWLTGEVSEKRDTGHIYFRLVETNPIKKSDKPYSIAAKIWISTISKIRKKLKDAGVEEFQRGDKIRVFGKLDYYDIGGELSFIIQDIDPLFAEGEFHKQKLLIENELYQLGIHDKNKQIPFPTLPLRLAVFSSRKAAGMGDFESKLSKSGYPFKITLFTTALQGKNVESEFIKNYQLLEQIGYQQFDVALILRGGGDTGDLSAFNNINLAKLVALSPLKFFIAIGHDKDRSVLDEIATHAITPTHAADALIQICDELARNLLELQSNIELVTKHHLESQAGKLELATERFTSIVKNTCQRAESQLEKQKSELIRLSEKKLLNTRHTLTSMGQDLQNSAQQLTHHASMQLHSLENLVENRSNTLIHARHENLKLLSSRIHDISTQNLQTYGKELMNLEKLLNAYNPEKLFERGYVIMSDDSGKVIKSIQNVAPKDIVHIRMKDGKATASIQSVAPTSDNN